MSGGRILNFSEFYDKYSKEPSGEEKGLDTITSAASNFEEGFDDTTYDKGTLGPNRSVQSDNEAVPAQPEESGNPIVPGDDPTEMAPPEEPEVPEATEEVAEEPEIEKPEAESEGGSPEGDEEDKEEAPKEGAEEEETEEEEEELEDGNPEKDSGDDEEEDANEAVKMGRILGFNKFILESRKHKLFEQEEEKCEECGELLDDCEC